MNKEEFISKVWEYYLILEGITIQQNLNDTLRTEFTTTPVCVKVQTHLKSLFIDLFILPITHPAGSTRLPLKEDIS